MPAEYGAKALDIDPAAVADLILSKGGQGVSTPTLQRRYVSDVTPGDQSKWIRLRDTGRKTALAVKRITHDGIDGTYEVEVTVDSLDTATDLLAMIGFQPKGYQEKRRTSFLLDGAQLEIDEWSMIPPHLEIEAVRPPRHRPHQVLRSGLMSPGALPNFLRVCRGSAGLDCAPPAVVQEPHTLVTSG